MLHSRTVGWDIGGAHIKAAVINENGVVIDVYQHPCPLWKGLDQLQQAVNSILSLIKQPATQHVMTMTGELVDLFPDRDQGVEQIISTMQQLLAGKNISVYAGQHGLLAIENINPDHYQSIASSNWLASASYVAKSINNGLFIDIGSTTTDILLMHNADVQAQGITDFERLKSQELIYSGIIRTAVMAIVDKAYFKGQEIPLMAEHFATMADIYRLTNELDEAHDQSETADGQEKSIKASARRLSRMTGWDFTEDEMPYWQHMARNIRSQHVFQLQQGCERQLSRYEETGKLPFVGAGVGRFLVRQIAANLGHPYLDFSDLFNLKSVAQSTITTADCAPAVAVACLGRQQ